MIDYKKKNILNLIYVNNKINKNTNDKILLKKIYKFKSYKIDIIKIINWKI